MNIKSEENFDLGKAAVNLAAETAIASQLDSAQNIAVEVDSQTAEIVQGKVDSVKIEGKKVIAFQDIHLEEINISSKNISIDLIQAVLGNIALDEPGSLAMEIVFTESDCDHLLNSEYVKILLSNLTLEIASRSASFFIQQARCSLQAPGEVSLAAGLILNSQEVTKNTKFAICFGFRELGKRIKFKGGEYLTENDSKLSDLDLDETVAIMNKIQDLLYLRHFSNSDLAIDITGIEITAGQLRLNLDTKINRIPDSIDQSIASVASEINTD